MLAPPRRGKRTQQRMLWFAGAVLLLLFGLRFRAVQQLPPPCNIPKIIHQTWKHDLVSYTAARRIQSWLKQNPDWTYHLWTNEDNVAFVAQHYPQHVRYRSVPRSPLLTCLNAHLCVYSSPCSLVISRR